MNKSDIRNASTVILLRDRATNPRVLMGQRGKNAVFMPNKFVFPGGAIDDADSGVALVDPLNAACAARLQIEAVASLAEPLVLGAIREVWEETGLMLGRHTTQAVARAKTAPADWQAFFNAGLEPCADGMEFVFRAITPPGRPRRFDARFFLVDADRLVGDIDDFSAASDELSHLQWVALNDARKFDLPFITEIVLAELEARLNGALRDDGIPYFWHDGDRSYFLRL